MRDPSYEGRVPFRLRVGVTGHRVLEDEARVVERIRESLGLVRRLVVPTPATPVRLTVVSSLAEGADRLVAREILADPTALLEAPLPLPKDELMRHFAEPASRAEFESLLARAAIVLPPPRAAGTEDAYERAGRYVVDRSDVLLAIWDGEPARGQGGTADTIEYARTRAKPLIWICTGDDLAIRDEVGKGIPLESFKRHDRFNRIGIKPHRFQKQLALERRSIAAGGDLDRESAKLDRLLAWAHPHLVRADILALRYQNRFYRLTEVLYAAAPLAVAVIAIQLAFDLEPAVVWIEVALLFLAFVVVVGGRRFALQRRWLEYRFLAERFRSAPFLAIAGLSERHEGGIDAVDVAHSSEEWVRRAFGEVWNNRPADAVAESVDIAKSFLSRAWIGEQLGYYGRAGRVNHRRHRVLLGSIYVTFLVTIVAAVLHSVEVGHESVSRLLIVVSLTLPAVGAALTGLGAQREYHRHSQRYHWIARSLAATGARMDVASDAATVGVVAAQAESILLEENRDWLGIMRFHDFELHV